MQYALFYIQNEGGSSEVIICRVHKVLGGPQIERRTCSCSRCVSSSCSEPVTYVSRRSQEWVMFATREDPQQLRVAAALRERGIQKRPNNAEGVSNSGQLLVLHPHHLVKKALFTFHQFRVLFVKSVFRIRAAVLGLKPLIRIRFSRVSSVRREKCYKTGLFQDLMCSIQD